MAFSVPFILLFVGLFTAIVGGEDCGTYGGGYKQCDSGTFCCGTCSETYCCSDLHNRLKGRIQCVINELKALGAPPRRESVRYDLVPAVVMPILVALIVVLISCWVCPCCCLHKRFRRPRPVIATTTVRTTQYLPQPGPQFWGYQPLPPDPAHRAQPMPTDPAYRAQPMPTDPAYRAQPMPTGAFGGHPYQEAAGPGCPVPFSQAPCDGGQAMCPIQPDYTSAPPAYNPTYTDTPAKTSY